MVVVDFDKPRPEPTPDSQAYWDALNAHLLVFQHCTQCGQTRHYPRPVCDRCFSMDYDWMEASGRGTVYSWTVNHHAFHPAFKADTPYVTITVDMEEGVRMQGPLIDAIGDDLSIGLAVEVDFQDVRKDLTLPYFRLIDRSPGPTVLSLK